MRNGSVESSLRIRLLLSLVAAAVILWLLGIHSLRLLTEQYVRDRLEQEVESILTEISLDERDLVQLSEQNIDAIFHHTFSGHYFQITLRGGEKEQVFRSRSLKGERLEVPLLVSGETRYVMLPGPQGQSLMVLSRALTIREYTLTIAVAENIHPILWQFQSFQWDFTLIVLAVAALLAVVQFWIIRHGFRPLRTLLEELLILESGGAPRLRESGPREIIPLVGFINHLLGLTDKQLARSRSALSNLSHALKLPVNAIAHLSERPELQQFPEIRQTLAENSATLISLIERQLKRARLVDPMLPGNRFHPAKEVPLLARTLKSIYFGKSLSVELELPPDLVFRGDREDMMELTGNLADNACKWANSRVRLSAGRERGRFWLQVEDDGPGCDDEALSHLTERGSRLDESKSGHGLGLAIAQDVVTQYGGSLSFGRSSALGGFLARVVLPE